MNSIHNKGENDKTLKEGLDQFGQAYSKLEHDEPPELLDMAILNSAHRAVEKKPRWMKFGWLHGLTTTAVFVLAFSLILDQRESTPVFDNGVTGAEPVRLQKEKVAEKQASDVRAELRSEMEPKADMQDNSYRGMQKESTAKVGRSRPSDSAQHVLQAKAETADNDMELDELMLEELPLNEMAVMADSPAPDEAEQRAAPAAVAAPMMEPHEAKAQARKYLQTDAEQELLAIIKLKQSGDPAWESQLESFMESYPDYVLPEALRNP